jgi:uncharacterized protein
MLLDANILLYAVNVDSPFHQRANSWLTEQLTGSRRVGIPWQSLVAFLRISTHPRVFAQPLSPATAMDIVDGWLAVGLVWVPIPGVGHGAILREVLLTSHAHGALISDVHLAALAIEHGLTLVSADSDFARFPGVAWANPVA